MTTIRTNPFSQTGWRWSRIQDSKAAESKPTPLQPSKPLEIPFNGKTYAVKIFGLDESTDSEKAEREEIKHAILNYTKQMGEVFLRNLAEGNGPDEPAMQIYVLKDDPKELMFNLMHFSGLSQEKAESLSKNEGVYVWEDNRLFIRRNKTANLHDVTSHELGHFWDDSRVILKHPSTGLEVGRISYTIRRELNHHVRQLRGMLSESGAQHVNWANFFPSIFAGFADPDLDFSYASEFFAETLNQLIKALETQTFEEIDRRKFPDSRMLTLFSSALANPNLAADQIAERMREALGYKPYPYATFLQQRTIWIYGNPSATDLDNLRKGLSGIGTEWQSSLLEKNEPLLVHYNSLGFTAFGWDNRIIQAAYKCTPEEITQSVQRAEVPGWLQMEKNLERARKSLERSLGGR